MTLYVMHVPVALLIIPLVATRLGMRWVPLAIPVTIGIALTIAYLAHLVVEKPFIKGRKVQTVGVEG